jgi:alkylated DNA repair dioxygenase AlkB
MFHCRQGLLPLCASWTLGAGFELALGAQGCIPLHRPIAAACPLAASDAEPEPQPCERAGRHWIAKDPDSGDIEELFVYRAGRYRNPTTLHKQADLFSIPASLAIDATFATAKRTVLDEHSWIEVVPGWISGADILFEQLAAAVPWRQHYRRLFEQTFREPRLTAEYRNVQAAPNKTLVDTAAVLSAHYRVGYDSLWLNFYRDGNDSTGWHRDRFSCRRPECIVPVLTLGSMRRFLLKPRAGGASVAFSPRSGDLIVMGGRCQEDWVHAVPKLPGLLEPRISVNFQSSMQARRKPHR